MTGRLPMTRGRALALLIGVPLALGLIAGSALDEVAFAGIGSYQVSLHLQVHGTAQFSVGSGDLTVGQVTGDRVLVTGKARYSLVRSTVTHDVAASGTSVSTQCDFPFGICDFHLQAGLPAGTRALISDGSGDLRLRGLHGPVNATDGEGNIQASALTGPVVLQAGSGDILGSGLTSADVTATDGSGDVTLTLTRVPDRVTIYAGSGNVHLILPPGRRTHYHVNASTGEGSRRIDVPQSRSSPYVIIVSDGSGDISITN